MNRKKVTNAAHNQNGNKENNFNRSNFTELQETKIDNRK
jgi:hypothetical protein